MSVYTPIPQPNPRKQLDLSRKELKSFSPGYRLKASDVNDISEQVNNVSSIVGGNRQLRRSRASYPGLLNNKLQLRFSTNGVALTAANLPGRVTAARNVRFLRSWLYFPVTDPVAEFEIQLQINTIATGPVMDESSVNPVDMQAVGYETEDWVADQYLQAVAANLTTAPSWFEMIIECEFY